jgi:hypothetical protein
VRLSSILLSVLIASSAALAQNQAQRQPLPPQQNWIQQNWFPQEIEKLGQNASSRTEFSLDHNMVVLASKMDQDDDSLRRVIAGWTASQFTGSSSRARECTILRS